MLNIIAHGKYTHIRECPECKCVFTYIDRGNSIRNEFQDMTYVRDMCKFMYKYIHCPECDCKIVINKEKDNETLVSGNNSNIQL